MARIIRIIRIKLFANNYSHKYYSHREYSQIISRPTTNTMKRNLVFKSVRISFLVHWKSIALIIFLSRSILPKENLKKITLKRILSIQWVKKIRTQLLHSYVVTLFSINNKIRTSACRALILFFQNHRMSEVSKMVCYAIVACLDPAHSMLIDATFSRKSVKSLRKTQFWLFWPTVTFWKMSGT